MDTCVGGWVIRNADSAIIEDIYTDDRIPEGLYRDDATHEHAGRVADTSRRIARQLGLPVADGDMIGQAAPLHDLGKLAVPEALLLKPGPLTASEFERVKEHAAAGASILAGSKSAVLRVAGEIALTHHEWWNGNGYPAGLNDSEIPVAGRVVALADVFDALIHERPYKPAWPVEQAVAEIRRLSGRQFDPDVVEAFDQVWASSERPDQRGRSPHCPRTGRGGVSAGPRAAATRRAARRPRRA
jgi:response regulator RpfG family c-di-GMP phosphodiesterase